MLKTEKTTMSLLEKQRRDLKTKKVRNMPLALTNKQSKALKAIAESKGTTPSKLLESFIKNLTNCYDSGSDETRLANSWLDRTSIEEA